MKRSRLVLAVVLAGTFIFAGVGPASAKYTHPDAATEQVEARRDLQRIGRATKWRPRRLATAVGDGSQWGVWVAYEPYRNTAGSAFLQVLFNGGKRKSVGAEGSATQNLMVTLICKPETGATVKVGPQLRASAAGSSSQNDGVYSQTRVTPQIDFATGSGGCGAAREMVGIEVQLVVVNQNAGNAEIARSEPLVWHVDNANRGPEPPDTWNSIVCEEVFGPPPWYPGMTGVLWGQVIAIEDTECLTIQDDWGRDFAKVCENPPDFEFYTVLGISVFPTVASLGDWIGHYATCLFVPQRGFETDAIGVAAEDGWMGSTRTILASIAADFGASGSGGASALIEYERNHEGGPPRTEFPGVSFGGVEFEDQETARAWLGDGLVDSVATPPVVPLRGSNFGPMAAGCGDFVESLPVVGEGISSCSLGGVWPEHFRTAAGALLMITAAFSALFAILRFMGVRYGWSTG